MTRTRLTLDRPIDTMRSEATMINRQRQPGMLSSAYLTANVDTTKSTWPLTGYSFMSGFIDAICFSATYIWCGFQTGNTAQLAIALCRLYQPHPRDTTFHIADQQALVSLLSFLAGSLLARVGDRIGPKSRIWLITGTMLQAIFTAAAAITIWKSGQANIGADRGDPSWTNAMSFVTIGLMSASMGLQGVMAKRLDTQFSGSVVLTTVWVELMSDRDLFRLRRSLNRDHKWLCVIGLFSGAVLGRTLLEYIPDQSVLAIGVGIRVILAASWMLVPAPPAALEKPEVKEQEQV